MPYITLAEQGRPDPTQQIQGAAQSAIQQNLLRQQMQQSSAAFPIEQQQRQATANESTANADNIRARIALQLHAQDTQNQLADLSLQFQKETDPIKKAQLSTQVDQLKAEIQNIGFRSNLLGAQSNEANARSNYFNSKATKDDPGASPYNISETPGKPDAYGNIPLTKTWTDKDGNVVHTEQSMQPGRGQPRPVYKTEFDPASGQMKRIAGVIQPNPQTGELEANFPDEAAPDANAPQRNAVTDALVSKYFDAATGKPKTNGILGSGIGTGSSTIQPFTVGDRAALKQLLSNKQLVSEYGLNAYNDLAGSVSPAGAASAAPETSPSPPGTGATNVIKPSSVTSSSGNQDDMTRTGDGGPSGAVKEPELTAGQDTPSAGVGTGGAAVKTGNVSLPGAPAASGPVPIRSGRSGQQIPASGSPTVTASKPGAGSAKRFQDLNVKDYFMQGGVRYQKTGPKSAQPAPVDTASPGQSPSMPSAMGS